MRGCPGVGGGSTPKTVLNKSHPKPHGDPRGPRTLPYGRSRLQSNLVPREDREAGTRLEKGGGGSQQCQRAGGDGPRRPAAQREQRLSGGGVPRAAPAGGSQ